MGCVIDCETPFLEGITAFPQRATVYFVNHLIICQLQSVWVWNISSVLQNPVVKAKATSCRDWSALVRNWKSVQLNENLRHFLIKHDIMRLPHHGFACDCRKIHSSESPTNSSMNQLPFLKELILWIFVFWFFFPVNDHLWMMFLSLFFSFICTNTVCTVMYYRLFTHC